jgi:hypothetical protein
MNEVHERPWVRIVGSVILGGCGVLAAMVPLYCSKQKNLETQIVKAQTDQSEIEVLQHRLAQLQSTISEKDAEIAKLKERPTLAANTGGTSTVQNPSIATATEIANKEAGPAPVQRATRSVTEHEFLFQLKGCTLSGSAVKCDLLITNKAGDRVLIIDRDERSRIIDDAGREYRATFFALGAVSSTNYARSNLPGDVPIGGQIQFEGVKEGTKKLQLLEIHCSIEDAKGTSEVIKFASIEL